MTALALIALALAACSVRWDQADVRATAEEVSQAPKDTTPLSAIALHPESYNGMNVSVYGTVLDLIGERAFILNDTARKTPLLVVMAEPDSRIPLGRDVVLSGRVRIFDLPEIERASGVDLRDDLFASNAGQPVIIAQSLNLAVRGAGSAHSAGGSATL